MTWSDLRILGRLSSGDRGSISSSQDPSDKSRNVSSISIKTVKRGFSTEADKLLNYLVRHSQYTKETLNQSTSLKEKGVFDAIERQYLKSFVFAVYLVRVL